MDPITRQVALASAKAGGETIDDVFSVDLYTGSAAGNTVTNGIDLSGEGGLVWLKNRDNPNNHYLFDTQRAGYYLWSDSHSYQQAQSNTLTSYNSDGFTLGGNSNINNQGDDFVAWTFRKAPKFFDVVTYAGNYTARTISHNLDSVPGFIWVKNLSEPENWYCYHPAVGNERYLSLNSSIYQQYRGVGAWNSTNPTSSVFSIGTDNEVNKTGNSYVAYLFAEDTNFIKCGSYTGNGTTSNTVNVGFEPQYLLIKAAPTNFFSDWYIFDNTRGVGNGIGAQENILLTSSNGSEFALDRVAFTSTGFTVTSGSAVVNQNAVTYVYMAIAAP